MPQHGGPRFGFHPDHTPPPQAPYHDPFPQVPTSTPQAPYGGGGGSNDAGFDDLARRFEDLKNRK